MIKRILLIWLTLFSFDNLALAQEVPARFSLAEVRKELNKLEKEKLKRIAKYTSKNEVVLVKRLEDGTIVTLDDVLENGHPIYISTVNDEAAVTSGAAALVDKNTFGLILDGSGVKIGVWDGGRVLVDHVELEGKVKHIDNASQLSRHATHVTGTIIARGVREDSRGMAFNGEANIYNWDNDHNEMSDEARPDQSSILISNHSYGLLKGWDRGRWYGDPEISELEDYKFGWYNSDASNNDRITYAAPYYTIVWAAGNDRNENGTGYPQDGPYDIIDASATAKNIITVGAVNKIEEYTDASDVTMSSFSSWGPTDDGRIKPDIVGAGVGVISSASASTTSYASLNGTSMASPNVAGTLALIQQMNKKLDGNFLKSASLKGLMIHTAREAGESPGPDYSYGWGLINGKGMGELLTKRNSSNNLLEETSLADGATYNRTFTPKVGTRVVATICWTDPPADAITPQLDAPDLRLIHDLDMRISNELTENMPYILNPAAPSQAASTGDNFRDNVEKIEFIADGSSYDLTISHKGTLTTASQDFTLVLSYESDEVSTLFWIGENNNFNSPLNWSETSGGEPANVSPEDVEKLVFDINSFEALKRNIEIENEEGTFILSEDVQVTDLMIFGEEAFNFNLNGHTLTVKGDIINDSENIKFTGEGTVIISSEVGGLENDILNAGNLFSEIDLVLDYPESNMTISGQALFSKLTVSSGMVFLEGKDVQFDSLIVEENGGIALSEESLLNIGGALTIETGASISGGGLLITGEVNMVTGGEEFTPSISVQEGSTLNLNDVFEIESMLVSGTLNINQSGFITDLTMFNNSELVVEQQTTLTLNGEVNFQSEESSEITLLGKGEGAVVAADGHKVYCFDNLVIEGLDATGSVKWNAGESSSITNSQGWLSKRCDEVLFADYKLSNLCEESLLSIDNTSTGLIASYEWYLNDELVSTEENPLIFLGNSQDAVIRLEVSDDENTEDYEVRVEIGENDLAENEITLSGNGTLLRSEQQAEFYQWIRDGEIIEGENSRFLAFEGIEGTYRVVTYNDRCSRTSEEFTFAVTSTEEPLAIEEQFSFYPNPTEGEINLLVTNDYIGKVEISLVDLSGRVYLTREVEKNKARMETKIVNSEIAAGSYLLVVKQGGLKHTEIIIINP